MHTCDLPHPYVWHDSCIRVTWLMHTCDMTHSFAWQEESMCVTCLIHVCCMSHELQYVAVCCRVLQCVAVCCSVSTVLQCVADDGAGSGGWHDSSTCVLHISFMCVKFLIHVCDASVWYGYPHSFTCVIWLIRLCHDSFICVYPSITRTNEWSRRATRVNEAHHACHTHLLEHVLWHTCKTCLQTT